MRKRVNRFEWSFSQHKIDSSHSPLHKRLARRAFLERNRAQDLKKVVVIVGPKAEMRGNGNRLDEHGRFYGLAEMVVAWAQHPVRRIDHLALMCALDDQLLGLAVIIGH